MYHACKYCPDFPLNFEQNFLTLESLLFLEAVRQCPLEYQYSYNGNGSCLFCPPSCTKCLETVDDVNYPCISCQTGYGYVANENAMSFGGACRDCSSLSLLVSYGSTRLQLWSSAGNSASLDGQLRVSYRGTWWSVCDDGWTATNTDVVCGELRLGRGIAFFSRYGLLKPNLPSIPIGFDDVDCDADDRSFFVCNRSDFGRHDCEDFESVGILCSGPSVGRLCVASCPLGQFALNGSVCVDCPLFGCLACGSDGRRCSRCEQGLWVSENDTCVDTCSSGHHGNASSGACEPCSARCRECEDGPSDDVCVVCADGLLLHNTECVGRCPSGTFSLANAPSAASQNVCVDHCPRGFFESAGNCSSCLLECASCSVSSDNCTSCPTGKVLMTSSSSANNRSSSPCARKCPDGYFPDARRICRRCSNADCVNCYLGGALCSDCKHPYVLQAGICVTSCGAGYFLASGACRPSCPKGFYGDFATAVCRPCQPFCSGCYSAQRCSVCQNGYFLKDGRCVGDCGQDMIAISRAVSPNVRVTGAVNPLDGRVELYANGKRQICTRPSLNLLYFYPILLSTYTGLQSHEMST